MAGLATTALKPNANASGETLVEHVIGKLSTALIH
jgi:hypothetical protein